MPDKRRPDIEKLTDYAKGRLTPEESLEVLDWVEKDQEVSANLKLILELENIPREEWERLLSGGR